jgi:hypothetical protein
MAAIPGSTGRNALRIAAQTAAAVSKGRRETVADWLMLLAAPILLGSLFLTWSHQLSGTLLSRYGGTAILQGVPRDPTAWQVYSAADVLLALVAAGLLAAALHGGRPMRVVLTLAVLVALAFTAHAISVPPANGATVFDPTSSPPAYVPDAPAAGPGETLALVALAIGLAGLLLSLTAD